MKKDETAIILIEFQNDFTTEGGIFHDAVKNVMDETNMLSNTFDLVEKARKEGVHVIHIPISFTENYSELTSNPYGILKGIVDTPSCFVYTRTFHRIQVWFFHSVFFLMIFFQLCRIRTRPLSPSVFVSLTALP